MTKPWLCLKVCYCFSEYINLNLIFSAILVTILKVKEKISTVPSLITVGFVTSSTF